MSRKSDSPRGAHESVAGKQRHLDSFFAIAPTMRLGEKWKKCCYAVVRKLIGYHLLVASARINGKQVVLPRRAKYVWCG